MDPMLLIVDSCYCRLCAEENKNGTYLFSEEENSQNLSQLINKYLPLKVSQDKKFPNSICPGCLIQLEATKLFMDLIVEGQKKLREMYRKQQELLQRQERQKGQVQKSLQSLNPNTTIQSYTCTYDECGEIQSFIQVFSDGPLFPPEHELSLRAEGLDRPRKKRGRHAKQVLSKEETENKEKEGEKNKLVQEIEEESPNGRRRRKIRPPAKFAELVQGEELENILKKEGVINDEDCIESKSTKDEVGILIGTVKFENDEKGEPVYLKPKLDAENGFRKFPKKKKYQCEFCEREYFEFGKYALHKKTHIFTYACKENDCLYESHSKIQFLEHQKETGHEEVTAIAVSDIPPDKEQLPAAETDNNPRVRYKYKCKKCSNEFSSNQSLNVHVRSIHNGEKSFACDKCNRTFSYANSLKIHLLSHLKGENENEKPQFPCDMCDKVMNHPSGLVYHKATEHSNGKQFVCNKCGKSFKIGQQLQRHQMVHSSRRPYECSKCPATFKTQSNLAHHQLVHTGEKKYCCSECGHKFGHKTSLILHKRWHKGIKPFKCDICEKAFTQKGNLVEHQRIHTGEKPYICDQCGRSFTTSSQFKLHIKRHTGEKPLMCEYCNKTFLHRDTFKTHLRRHLNERPFVCKTCNRSFPEAWALKRHDRIHTKEKPYKCEVCGKAFADSSNKQKHIKSHNVIEYIEVMNKEAEDLALPKQKETTLLEVIEQPHETALDKMKIETSNLQFTQLVDPDGNPISITTQDGQNIPVVTNGEENNIQGLLPDGTLIPINLDKNMVEEDVESSQGENIVALQIENNDEDPKSDMLQGNNQALNSPNIQLITDEDGQEMCLVTYALEENREDENQALGSTIFLAST